MESNPSDPAQEPRGRSTHVLRGESTRQALVDAARAAFGSRGYEETTVDDIVERAGVTKGAFYHHFGGKREIFLLVFEEVKRRLSQAAFVTHAEHDPFARPPRRRLRLERFLSQSDEEVWAELRRRCRRFIELQTEPEIRRIVLIDGPSVLSWSERQQVAGKHDVVLLRADLRRAKQRGLIHDLPLRVVSTLLAGALSEASMLVGLADDRDGAVADVMSTVERFLEGLRKAPD